MEDKQDTCHPTFSSGDTRWITVVVSHEHVLEGMVIGTNLAKLPSHLHGGLPKASRRQENNFSQCLRRC